MIILTAGGIVGIVWCKGNADDNLLISNTLNIGTISQNARYKGEIIGRHVKSTVCTLENCFYKLENTNQGIGSGKVTGETIAKKINTGLIETLNQYVTNYNSTNDEKLKTWELSEGQVKFN